jgi:hypothetical protein
MSMDIDKLKEVAKKATPGPWKTWIEGEGKAWGSDPGVCIGKQFLEGFHGYEDVRYIVAADPTTILALIADLKAEKAKWWECDECGFEMHKQHVTPGMGCPVCGLAAAEKLIEVLRGALIDAGCHRQVRPSMGTALALYDTYKKGQPPEGGKENTDEVGGEGSPPGGSDG